MASFPTTVTPSDARKTSKPTVTSIEFGSGYSQRVVTGLNQDLKTWNFTWQNLTETNADEIETFLEARKGSESFTFTPPGEGSSSTYICSEWNKTVTYLNRATIIAAFIEVAEA
jgi:phage-related protein